jgi:hypothetical protein
MEPVQLSGSFALKARQNLPEIPVSTALYQFLPNSARKLECLAQDQSKDRAEDTSGFQEAAPDRKLAQDEALRSPEAAWKTRSWPDRRTDLEAFVPS